jgi:hypothetical protein
MGTIWLAVFLAKQKGAKTVQWGELEKTLATNLKQKKNLLTEKNRLHL